MNSASKSRKAYDLTRKTGVSSLELEKAISKDCYYSFPYARNVLKGRFELGEEVISKNVFYSYYYANYILKGRFKLGEEVIVKIMNFSYLVKVLGYDHE